MRALILIYNMWDIEGWGKATKVAGNKYWINILENVAEFDSNGDERAATNF